jgi:hypothetical protein
MIAPKIIRCFRKVGITLVILFFFLASCRGQISSPGHPFPLNYPGVGKLVVYELQVPQEEKSRLMMPLNLPC